MSSEGQRSVLITGASGGVDQATASLLLRYGWRVFAADITPADRDSTPSSDRFIPIHMDVTGSTSIRKAFPNTPWKHMRMR